MMIRLHSRIRRRQDDFGGICYVPHRDDLFVANKKVFSLVAQLTSEWVSIPSALELAYKKLAELGICDTDPPTSETAYSGPSFLGQFEEIPTITQALVVNCFSTAFCPLRCLYCHADDLMAEARASEIDDGSEVDNVVATATTLPAMVAVITGGDPLTKPERAVSLITRLAEQKALVLDTSGVGFLDDVLPVLKQYQVHVRVSLDSVGRTNDKLRPIDKRFFDGREPSRYYAQQTIERCLAEGLGVTVQTVVSTHNENIDELRQLRTLLLGIGVKHWVLHIAVEGGSARRIETIVRKKGGRGIVPRGAKVYRDLSALVADTRNNAYKLDIRCTDTNSTPNSVLLIDSRGDLYTEGYAHIGKVQLFSASSGRPDLVTAKWMHIDRFGHAKRYLNWNRWLYEGKSLEEICIDVPIPEDSNFNQAALIVETEAKYSVVDVEGLREALQSDGFLVQEERNQRDEYYDIEDRSLSRQDYVVRIRLEGGKPIFAFKGPRFYTKTGDSSRLEFQFSMMESVLRDQLDKQGLLQTWFFEKRRTDFRSPSERVVVSLDEVPEIGFFAEIEGPLPSVRATASKYARFLGPAERRNYQQLFLDFKEKQGLQRDSIFGAAFPELKSS
jgi:predicted adenylyl cyclase CyaB